MAEVLEMEPMARQGLRREGLLERGDRVGWQGSKFGLPQMHVSRIARFEPAGFFQSVMEQGRFKRFEHDHSFNKVGDHTLMLDHVRFSMPLGLAGRLVGRQIVLPHVVKLVRARMLLLKRLAESDEWQRYLPPERSADETCSEMATATSS
jgi:ligand-binding SRPBCC domain-containing protein